MSIKTQRRTASGRSSTCLTSPPAAPPLASAPNLDLLTEKQAAARLNVQPKTLQNWRWRGEGPQFVKLAGGKLVRYRVRDLEAFIDAGLRRSTSDPGGERA